MKRIVLVLAASVALGAAAGLTALAAAQQNVPGYPTIARTLVINRSAAESIPVTLRSAGDVLPVTVMGAPALTLAPATIVGVREVRQTWEYRQVRVGVNDDALPALNAAGTDGWEAVGSSSAGTVTVWTMKRPR